MDGSPKAAPFDVAKARDFGTRMSGVLNAGGAALMMSIGHRTGLFDTMAGLDPATSAEIAAAAGLNERYVREWLGAMVTSEIVSYDPTTDTYDLAPEHAACLTRAAGPRNLAAYMQYIPMMAQVEAQIVDRFRHGGGIPYPEYADFHRVMAEVSGQRYDAMLVSDILPLVPGLVEQLEAGCTVADVGCGSGRAVNLMAAAFPNSTFVGIDLSPEAVERGTQEAAALGLTNVSFVVHDAATLDDSVQYDFVTTFDAVHDQAHPRRMVSGVYAALKPDGYWLCVDISASSHVGENIDHPIGTFGYSVSCMHCMSVSLAYDGEGLGAMWGVQKAREIFTEAGFVVETVHRVDFDAGNNYYVCRKRRGNDAEAAR